MQLMQELPPLKLTRGVSPENEIHKLPRLCCVVSFHGRNFTEKRDVIYHHFSPLCEQEKITDAALKRVLGSPYEHILFTIIKHSYVLSDIFNSSHDDTKLHFFV